MKAAAAPGSSSLWEANLDWVGPWSQEVYGESQLPWLVPGDLRTLHGMRASLLQGKDEMKPGVDLFSSAQHSNAKALIVTSAEIEDLGCKEWMHAVASASTP